MRSGGLFAGYGGLDMAVAEVFGAEPAWFSEIDEAPSKILAHHWPEVPNHGDITQIDWDTVGPVDILTGGFPCQDVSAAGKRAGMHPDTRSGLWNHMAYAISKLRPRYVVAENVRGLLSAEAHSDMEPCPWCLGDGPGEPALRALGAVLGDLAELGYDAQWCGLRAADVGAPHGRYRIFILARNTENLVIERGRPVHGVGTRNSRPAGGAGGSLASHTDGAVGGERRVAASGQEEGRRAWPDAGGRDRAPAADSASERHGDTRTPGQRGLASTTVAGAAPNTASDRWDEGRTEPAGKLGGSDAAERGAGFDQWGRYAAAIHRWELTTGRAAPAATEPTSKGAQRLSPRFVEWMMGLPAGHVTDVPGVNRNAQLKALGNGVVPQQATAALRHMFSQLEVAA